MAENLELEKTLKVDGQEYNINAVQADKVANKLTLKPMNLDGTVSAEGSGKWTIFDGSSAQSLNIVPAAGGQFEGKIRVPDLVTAVNDKDVLNYKDIVSKVVDRLLNTSAMATWNDNKLSFTDTNTPAIHGICVVLGNELDLLGKEVSVEDPTSVIGFSKINNDNWLKATSENPPTPMPKWLQNYLYICKDTGNLYFGSAKCPEATLLYGKIIKPQGIEVAVNQWITKGEYGLDLANSDVINLNGLFFSDYANLNNEGLNFVQKHPDEHTVDHTTIKDPEKAAEIIYDRVYARNGKFYFTPNCKINNDVQKAIVDENGKPLYEDPKPFEVYHSGTIIPVANGGTGSDTVSGACNTIVNNQEIAPKSVTVYGDQWFFTRDDDGKYDYGINLNNSDIVGVNGLIFNDYIDAAGEGIFFPRSVGTDDTLHTKDDVYDSFFARGGELYFAPGCKLFDQDGVVTNAEVNANKQILYHKGNINEATAGQANRIKVSYKASTNTAATNKYANITIAPSASYPKGPTGGNEGDIMILF